MCGRSLSEWLKRVACGRRHTQDDNHLWFFGIENMKRRTKGELKVNTRNLRFDGREGLFNIACKLVLELQSALPCGFMLTDSGDKKRSLSSKWAHVSRSARLWHLRDVSLVCF